MKKHYVLVLLHVFILQPIVAQDYTVSFEIKTTSSSENFPSLVSNKMWGDAPIIDLISTSNMGITLASEKKIGWSIFMQPNGAWGWNIGDGNARLDYLPTTKQAINDGTWHQISVSFYLDKKTAWLYFDERHVAIYSLSELKLSKEDIIGNLTFSGEKQLNIRKENAGKFSVISKNNKGDDQNTQRKLTVMSWNIWHGGRHNGIEKGIAQTITAIRESGADMVCMQETYGSGPAISDALGTLFYYRSSNLSVHSKYPIVDTYDLYQPFRFGGVRVKMGTQLLDVFSLWIHYLPSISKLYPLEPVSTIILEENKTRGKEVKEILAELKKVSISEDIPMIIGGDFNSPSHLDWGEDMKAFHHDYTIKWPVSTSMFEEGFIDSFREMATVPKYNLGYTWSPRFHESLQQRIDYLYYKGGLKCIDSYVKGYTYSEWPSDHAAIVAKYRFN
jgi:exonuclease III